MSNYCTGLCVCGTLAVHACPHPSAGVFPRRLPHQAGSHKEGQCMCMKEHWTMGSPSTYVDEDECFPSSVASLPSSH